MNWNDPNETEQEYLDRTRGESRSATGLMFMLGGILSFAFKIVAVFGVFIYTGYLLSGKLWGEETDKFKVWGFALLFTYLIFCIIYFFKGIVIGLRKKNSKLWIFPWVICVFLCCIIPAYMITLGYISISAVSTGKYLEYPIELGSIYSFAIVHL